MRYLKMLGLAAIAATVLMSFAGDSTASADELCTEKANAENMCPAGKLIEKFEATLTGSAKLTDTEGTVLDTCTSGTVKITEIDKAHGNVTKSAGTTGTIPKEDITWGSTGTTCSFPTVTVKGGPVHATSAPEGGATLTATEAEVTINTVFFGSCVYGVGTGIDLGTVAQGGNTLTIGATIKKVSGAVCPETTVWEATYKVTNHSAAFYINN